jgi:hypothetical protein
VVSFSAAAGLAATTPRGASAAQPSETGPDVTPQPTPGADMTTSDILVETLIDWGTTHVFGIVGDGINSIIESLRKRQDRIRYIAVRHEEAAAFMASGWAKHTGGQAVDAQPRRPFVVVMDPTLISAAVGSAAGGRICPQCGRARCSARGAGCAFRPRRGHPACQRPGCARSQGAAREGRSAR